MPFNNKLFMKQKFQPRIESVPVPDLANWFDGEPVWQVRGLTGEELARVNEAVDATKNMIAMVEAMTQGSKDKAQAISEAMGLSDKTPVDTVKRLNMLIAGSVDPICDRQLAVKLADVYPVEFFTITGTILKLTGQGKVPGKLKTSGSTTEFEQPLPCAEKEEDSSMK